jgi:sugar/nucleoside kinase (ribokinase family)
MFKNKQKLRRGIMNLNRNEEKLLKILGDNPYISQKDIAQMLEISRPAVANHISSLQSKGYILGKPYVLSQGEYITCVGSANIDYTFKLIEDMKLGTSNPINSSTSFGGVIRNVAENLARLDCNVSLMSVVGNDAYGETLIQSSKKIMEVFAVDKLKDKTTGGYYSIINPTGNMDVGYADMSINNSMDRSWILEHKRHLNLSSWIIADLNISKEAVESLIEFSRNEEIPLGIIGVSTPKMKNLPSDLEGIDIIICNKDESQTYFKTENEDVEDLCQMWLDKGVKKAVVTDGTKGSYYGENNIVSHQDAFVIDDSKIVDVTGAGDSFSSALIYALIKEYSFKESIRIGTMSSSLTIQVPFSVNPKLSINLLKKELIKYENI